ncbi:MAG: glutathione S-transferase C-terminal domain-containing protein, partial [Sneathiella sp.]|nr:glutathione S-transferase C-terminal domain-containing protein [Sneathiella sp.]
EIPESVILEMATGTQRFILIASKSCPWSHRTLLARAVKKVEHLLPVHIAGGPRIQGYGLHLDGPLNEQLHSPLRHVHKLYALTDKSYTGRSTVPLLWDRKLQTIISNSSANIMRAIDNIDEALSFTLLPKSYENRINDLNQLIYVNLSNAVYRAGLAQTQIIYNDAIDSVFKTLEELENQLSTQRYLMGNFLSESDLQLFATLIRFDAVYNTHFRCTRKRLLDFKSLWAYSRDLYQWGTIEQTVDFTAILDGYYSNDGTHNTHKIIAERPHANWQAPHNRAELGARHVWTKASGPELA